MCSRVLRCLRTRGRLAEDPPQAQATDAEPAPSDEPVATATDNPPVQVGDQQAPAEPTDAAPPDAPAVASDAEPPPGEPAAASDAEPNPSPAVPVAKPIEPATPPAESSADPPARLDALKADTPPERKTPPERPRIPLDPASLDGVHPGTTTRAELHEKWGEPERSQRVAGGARELYRLKQLGMVRATISEDVVESLAVHVERPLTLAAVAERLALADVEPVDVYDEQGELLGAAYPERGVLLGYLPGSHPPRVFQVVVESIDAEPFLARAEARLKTRYADSLADVEQALELSPQSAQRTICAASCRCGSASLKQRSTAPKKRPPSNRKNRGIAC